jgi:hypothetical protein
VNIGSEIRLSGRDEPGDVGVIGAASPSLSPATPFPDHPEFDVILWVDTITLPGTPHLESFGKDLESWLFSAFSPEVAIVRPEWSKVWGFTNSSAFDNLDVIQNKIPNLYPKWNSARAILNKYDPNRVFTNDLIDLLLPN